MNVNLHHLELFYYTAKAKGISNAVKIIPYGIRQPAISQQLMKLEEEAGTKLFERKPFALTPAGERLYRFLSRFFDNIESELATLGGDAPIRFRIACPSIISAKYLPKLIGELTAKFPKLRPNVFEADGVQCLARLNRKEVDVAIAFSVQYKSKSLEIMNLAKFPMALVVPVGHRFAQKRVLAEIGLCLGALDCDSGDQRRHHGTARRTLAVRNHAGIFRLDQLH